MFQETVATMYGLGDGGCVAMFETDTRLSPEEIVSACKNATAEWLARPETYGDGVGGWELPDWDWNYGDMFQAIEENEELRALLQGKYGVRLESLVSFGKMFPHDEIAIPQESRDKELYGITV